jgi:hypothetical protein
LCGRRAAIAAVNENRLLWFCHRVTAIRLSLFAKVAISYQPSALS